MPARPHDHYAPPPRPAEYTGDTPTCGASAAGIEAMDRAMGEALDALDESGLADSTIVICTTDHGLAFPGRKCNLTGGGLGVFAFWRAPGLTAGHTVNALTGQVDFYATLCELLGLDPPDWLQGVSLVSRLRGGSDGARAAICGQINYRAAYQPERCVGTDRYKHIQRFCHRTRRVMCNCDDSESNALLLAHGWGDEVLYDLILDPAETVDIAPSCPELLQALRGQVAEWMEPSRRQAIAWSARIAKACRCDQE